MLCENDDKDTLIALKQYEELLDNGAITQTEFKEQIRKLLNLI